jgi:hypothetical protein
MRITDGTTVPWARPAKIPAKRETRRDADTP